MNTQRISELLERKSAINSMLRKRAIDAQLGNSHFSATAEANQADLNKMLANVELELSAERGDETAQATIKEKQEYLRDLAERCMRGDAAANAEQVTLTVERVNNYLTATTNPLSFFDVRNLSDSEDFSYINETGQEIGVADVGQDGKARTAQLVRNQDRSAIRHHILSTDELEFPLVDVVRGVIADPSKAQMIAARDLSLKLATKLWTTISDCAGGFVTTGAKQSRTYNAHSSIQTDNFPTTNVVDNSADAAFKLNSLISAHEYGAQWGQVFGQEIYPVEIRVPSKLVLGMAREISATTQITQQSLSNQIATDGYVHDLYGKNVVIRGDEMLSSGTAAKVYVRFNRPLGTIFFKPGLDKYYTMLNMAKGQNLGSVKVGKVWAVAVPTPNKVNMLQIQVK